MGKHHSSSFGTIIETTPVLATENQIINYHYNLMTGAAFLVEVDRVLYFKEVKLIFEILFSEQFEKFSFFSLFMKKQIL